MIVTIAQLLPAHYVHVIVHHACIQYGEECVPLLDFAERARTVNARGEYIDHRYSARLFMQCVYKYSYIFTA